jgi:malate synthase
VEAGHTVADQGILPEGEHHPEEVAAADHIGLVVEHRTDLVPAEVGRTVRQEEVRRTGLDLEEVDRIGLAGEHRIDLAVVRHTGLGVAAGHTLAEVGHRTGHRGERRTQQVGGWSSRP